MPPSIISYIKEIFGPKNDKIFLLNIFKDLIKGLESMIALQPPKNLLTEDTSKIAEIWTFSKKQVFWGARGGVRDF